MRRTQVPDDKWQAAKDEVRTILIARARQGKDITFGDLAGQIGTLDVKPNDPLLFELLDEVSSEEARKGNGMLSALVVRKSGDQKPGPGFFELASKLGRDTTDKTRCWVREINKVYQDHTS